MIPPQFKQVDQWFDDLYQAENTLYTHANGFQFLHTRKRGIRDAVVEIIVRGGSSIEESCKVPVGTAHFLEHMLMNPNSRFKDTEAQDRFKFGTRNRPQIWSNAGTSDRFTFYYAFGNTRGLTRCLEYVQSIAEYPVSRFEEFIENERGVIQAELEQSYPPIKKDESYAYDKFMLSEYDTSFVKQRVGTAESINAITVQDLKTLYNLVYVAENTLLSIQSPRALTTKQWKIISIIAESYSSDVKKFSVPQTVMDNDKLRYEHFQDDQSQGVFVSLNYFVPISPKKAWYTDGVPSFFLREAFRYITYLQLRENRGIIYSLVHFNYYPLWRHYTEGWKVNFGKQHFAEVLDTMYDYLYTQLPLFLRSKKGNRWLESQVSKYIFERTASYSSNYGRSKGTECLVRERPYLDEREKVVDYARSMTSEVLLEFMEKEWGSREPRVWMVSPYESEEIEGELKKTKWLSSTFLKND